MTNQEEITRQNILSDIRARIGGCFGCADGLFAGHPFDEERAKELRKLAYDNEIPLIKMSGITLDYLTTKGYNEDHIRNEMKKVNTYFSKKLK